MTITLLLFAPSFFLASHGVLAAPAPSFFFLAAQETEKPVCKDKTGVAWVHPFTDALKKSKDSGRLLLIKPIAFGTDDAGGW